MLKLSFRFASKDIDLPKGLEFAVKILDDDNEVVDYISLPPPEFPREWDKMSHSARLAFLESYVKQGVFKESAYTFC